MRVSLPSRFVLPLFIMFCLCMLIFDSEEIDVRVCLPSRLLRLLSAVVCCTYTFMLLFDGKGVDMHVSLPSRFLPPLFVVVSWRCILLFDGEWIE